MHIQIKCCTIEGQTVPKLELVAAALLSGLITIIRDELSVYFNVDGTFFWTDSMVTLHCFFGVGKEYGSFAQRFVSKIRSFVGHKSWYSIESGSNPNDILSRVASFLNLNKKNLWFYDQPSILRSDAHFKKFKTG